MVLCCLFCSVTRTLEEISLFSILPSVYGLRRARSAARYNVTGARRRPSAVKVFAMWYTWTTLLLVSCTLVDAAEVEEVTTTTEPLPIATTRAPPRTLDRQASELVWKNWLQGPESGNQNAPPRRITTKSLFITPLVCPKGQRLDRNGCIQGITVNQDEHERILLDKLNALFTTATNNGDVLLYDYGDNEPGPLQLSIPIALDPQAAPLQGQEALSQAQEFQLNYVKKHDEKPNGGANLEAELELLKLQNASALNQYALTNLHYPEKPKRDTPLNISEIENINKTVEEGQKEIIYGNVNVDSVVYNTGYQNQKTEQTEHQFESSQGNVNLTSHNSTTDQNMNITYIGNPTHDATKNTPRPTSHVLKKDGDRSKLNPENDYSDIGEAIKLISRYAEVTTDDNFSKHQKKPSVKEDSILGTRTKVQYRRNKPKPETMKSSPLRSAPESSLLDYKNKLPTLSDLAKDGIIYRYPLSSQESHIPPPNYPFRHLQDYWPGQTKLGGVYNSHENPRRHHHSYSHSFRQHGYPYGTYAGLHDTYPELKRFIRRVSQHHADPLRSRTNIQDLYSLLGLRHWFSSEGTSKR